MHLTFPSSPRGQAEAKLLKPNCPVLLPLTAALTQETSCTRTAMSSSAFREADFSITWDGCWEILRKTLVTQVFSFPRLFWFLTS